MQEFLEFVLHLDAHLDELITSAGVWTYAVMAAIIFGETGFVVLPFLPGDSLLFALGAVAARGSLSFWLLALILSAAAIAGNMVNYGVARLIGKRLLRSPRFLAMNGDRMERTKRFFDKHGGKAVIISRFLPIIRTVAPFVAGLGGMSLRKFALHTVTGGLLWVLACLGAGYLFGNIKVVKENFLLVVLGIIVVSLVPAGVEFLRAARGRKAKAPGVSPEA